MSEWVFTVLEDGRERGYNFLMMRATHPKFGSMIRMWSKYPSEKEIERFKRTTEMEK
jgi:hypothetical protein